MSRILTVVLFVAALAVATWGAVAFGTHRWRLATEQSMAQLQAAGSAPAIVAAPDSGALALPVARVSTEQYAALPPAVARYFALVLAPGQPIVQHARVRHEGEFALRPNEWKPFTSRQLYSTDPRGFVWDARIQFLPLVPMLVRDSYSIGRGSMLGALAGVVKIADVQGTEGLASGALLRYLAEAVWLPTALLPSEGVQWTEIDGTTARATVSDAGVTVWMDVHFGASGSIIGVSAIRQRDVNGESVPTPWEGRFSEELLTVDGMKIPISGEVAWRLPEGMHTYWRGRVAEAAYEYRHCVPLAAAPRDDRRCS